VGLKPNSLRYAITHRKTVCWSVSPSSDSGSNALVYAAVFVEFRELPGGLGVSPRAIGWNCVPGHAVDADPQGGQDPLAVPESSRTKADDRLPLDPLGGVEGGDGIVECRDVADVRPESSIPHPPHDHLRVLGDLGYEGEAEVITVAFKKPGNGELSDVQKVFNKAHNGVRAIGERGNSLLKTTFRALRNVSLCPWKIGNIVAAALVLLHVEHDRTT
jgi:hypothetical protein